MLKYLYSNNTNQNLLLQSIEKKIINTKYTNKFYIRSSTLETKDILILDNNSNFFLINKKNIEKHLSFLKNKNLLGKTLHLNNFIYLKKKYFKINFFINNKKYFIFISYLKLLFLLKKSIKINLTKNKPLLLLNKGKLIFFFFGLKGIFQRKIFNQLKKLLKKLNYKITIQQKFNIILKKYKNILLKTLILKNINNNKIHLIKNKYKNQISTNSIFLKNKKTFLKIKK